MKFAADRIQGVMLALASAFFFALAGIMVKKAVCSYDTDIFQLGFIRFFSAGILVMTISALERKPLRTFNKKYFLLRGFFGSAGNLICFLIIALAGLGRGMVLMQLTGVFGAVAAIFLLKEKLNIFLTLAVASAGAGILFFSGFKLTAGVEMLAFAGAACSGLGLVFVRRMNETDSMHTVFFSQCICGTILAAFTLIIAGFPLSWNCWIPGLLLTFFDAVGQYLMTAALKKVSVAVTGPLLMTTPVITLLTGIFFFSEKMDLFQWIGTILILTGSFTAATAHQCRKTA